MIIDAFNLVYFMLLILIAVSVVVISIIFRNKDEKTKDIFIYSIGAFNIILFIVYKIFLSQDGYDFNIWKELPLQLCNINMFIIPLAVLLKNKYLLSFGFYVAPLAALMAMTFPEHGFTGNSIFLMRNIGFYGTHVIIIVMGILLITFGYIKTSFKDVIYLIPITLVLGLFAFIVNLVLFAVTKVETNYFFTMNTSDISILNLFYNLIPVKFLYLLPAMLILVAYVCAFNGIKKLSIKLKAICCN